MNQSTDIDLARVFRAESARVVAALMHQCRDLSLVEDALQDAVLQACEQWPVQGQPDNCAAWLHAVAKRRLLDRLRQQRVRQRSDTQQYIEDAYRWRDAVPNVQSSIPDDRLRLIFSCCHPSLAQEAQVALTLKVICGLSSAQIARAFLLSEDTLNRRLSRAKQKIAKAGIAYEVPEGQALVQRLPVVLSVIYLLFNESFHAGEGPSLSREDLTLESIRLGRLLFELQPSCEAGGLLALMELHWARHAGRSSLELSYIPLEAQDRSRWDHTAIKRSSEFLFEVMRRNDLGPYQIQAAISALHAQAKSFDSVDWPQIAGLYAVLYRHTPHAVVRLNLYVAQSYAQGPEGVVAELAALAEPLASYQPYHAACADIARRLGRREQAMQSYQKALELSVNGPERTYLQRQMESLCRLP